MKASLLNSLYNSQYTLPTIIVSNSRIITLILLLIGVLNLQACSNTTDSSTTKAKIELDKTIKNSATSTKSQEILTAAARVDQWLPLLKGKKIGLVVNHTSMIGDVHLLDLLLQQGIEVLTIFAPEHGLRGKAGAGEQIKDGTDARTGIPVSSLHGEKKRPTEDQMAELDILVFDIQDVGARFYTYISTMHECMEACADAEKPILILDRPNPNGHYTDGPMMKKSFRSFVGMHPIPVVHGLTVAELAIMIKGEGWLKSEKELALNWVTCLGWDHQKEYLLPHAPSPNLPNQRSIYLYPSLCFFEGTVISVGRGTNMPFQVIGHPDIHHSNIDFTPQPNEGAKHPKLEGVLCHGTDLRLNELAEIRGQKKIDLSLILAYYGFLNQGDEFFLANHFIDNLAGSDQLRKQIQQGLTEEEIRASWQPDLASYRLTRQKYLLYKD